MATEMRKTQNQMLRESITNVCEKVDKGLSPAIGADTIMDRFSSRFSKDSYLAIEDTLVDLASGECGIEDAVDFIMHQRIDFVG